MQSSQRQITKVNGILITALLCISPLFGVLILHRPLAPYLKFPPTTRNVLHAPFRWPAFWLLLFFVLAVCLPFLYRLVTHKPQRDRGAARTYPFPWWGWVGGMCVAVFWVLAWSRFSFFRPLQRYTFFPLWTGYILVVNGLSCCRQGSCLLRSRSRFFWVLFPASTLFWWYFEYLNRFGQNWYYDMGEPGVSAAEYVIHASICFSTVLPAVLSTVELLGTYPLLAEPFARWRPVRFTDKKGAGGLLLAGSGGSLCFLAVFPDYLYPLVWISPLLVIVGMQLAAGLPTIFSTVGNGDWRPVVLPALAALLCGCFWEMWNWRSLAHWQYSVPLVQRFSIFEMPLLGYAGYLPFGFECAAVADLVDRKMRRK